MKNNYFLKYYKLYLISLLILVLAACSNGKIEEVSTKEEYIDQLDKLSDAARKKRLTDDVHYLTNLLQSAQSLQIYKSEVPTSQDETSDEKPYISKSLLLPSDSVKEEFSKLSHISAVQHYGQPQSSFDIRVDDTLKYLQKANFEYQVQQAYVAGTALTSAEVGLQSVDSITFDLIYTYLTQLDSIQIEPSKQTEERLAYKDFSIEVEPTTDQSLRLIYPIDLPIIDYCAHAMSDNGMMHYQKYSDYLIFGISPQVSQSLQELITLLQQASLIEDKTRCMQQLEALTEQQFTYLDTLESLLDAYNQQKDEADNTAKQKLKMPVDDLEQYATLLSPRYKAITLTFAEAYRDVTLYIELNNDTLRSEAKMRVGNEVPLSYHVYQDNIDLKYGIVDQQANIIIPASYSALHQTHELYYRVSKADDVDYQTYYLDTLQKALKPLPPNVSFVELLQPGIAIFENNKRLKGVLSDNKVEIVPFRYDQITIHGNTLIAKGEGANKRTFYELYNVRGKKINLPQIQSVHMVENNPNLIVRAIDGKEGLIGKDGILAIRPQYYGLTFLSDKLLRFNTDASYDPYSANDYIWGMIDDKGNVIRKAQYYSIGLFSDGMAPIYIKNGDKLRGGYIDTTGKEVIAPRYLLVKEFYKGYALVRQLENYLLIDKKGQIVKNFPKGTYVELVDYADPAKGSVYETSDGIDYDYRGKQVK